MIVVLGATGNTGSVVARRLLEAGKKVRAVGRDAHKLAELTRLGAESVTANADDKAELMKVFAGADSTYLMLPPRAKDPELLASGDKMSTAITEAVRDAGVSHAVLLSSIGAQLPEKTGPIRALHAFEEKLKRVPNLNVLLLRPGPFMENFLMLLPLVHSMGFLAGGIDHDVKMPLIAAQDIGVAAADALLKLDFSGVEIRELHGQRDLSNDEGAAAIGAAIGKPKLSYKHFPSFLIEQGMKQMGIPGKTASLMSEMSDAANKGLLNPLEPRSERNTTPTTIESWGREVFLPAYQGKPAGT
jgi:uncharacterized protein YbjT (DUF2867 family)